MNLRSDSPVLSATTLAAQLNHHLPIHVTSDVIQNHPKLAMLLEDLTQKITSSCLLKKTSQRLSVATTTMQQERQHYLEQDLLYHHIVLSAQSSTAPKCMMHVQDALTLSSLANTLQLSPVKVGTKNASTGQIKLADHSTSILSTGSSNSSDNSLYTTAIPPVTIIEDTVLNTTTLSRRGRQSTSSSVLLERAARLTCGATAKVINNTLCESLVQAWSNVLPCISPITDHVGGSVSNGEVQEHILQLKRQTQDSLRAVSRYSSEIQTLILHVDSQLVDYGESLHHIIQHCRLSHQPLKQLTHLTCTLHVQHYKLRFVELQLLCSSYSIEAVACLRSLKHRLSQLISDWNARLSLVQHKLEPYRHLDPSFLALLDEYNKLQTDLQFCMATNI